MNEIRKAVEKFKEKNGSITFTTKEIVIAIYERLDKHERDIAYNKALGIITTTIVTGLCLKVFIF